MESILSKRDQRKVKIIEYLINYQQTTLKLLCEEIELPMKTVWNDIKEINRVIAPVSIDTDANGMYLYIPPAYSIRYIYMQLLQQSNEYNLLEYIYFNDGLNLEDVAIDFKISVATLRRMITYINMDLKKFDIEIKTNPLSIQGDYQNMITIMIHLLSEKYLYEEDYLSSRQLYALNQLFTSSSLVVDKFYNYPDFKKLRLWIYVSTICFKNHQQNQEITNINPIIYDIFDFEKNIRAYKEYERVFGIELSPQSIMFIFRVFINSDYVFSYHQLMQASNTNTSVQKKVKRITTILDRLSTTYEISLDNKEDLITDIYNILSLGNDMKPYIIYDKRKTFIQELTHHHLLFYQTSMKLIKTIFEDSIKEDRINEMIYMIITHWKNLTMKLEENFQAIQVCILMDTDVENVEVITDLLRQRMIYKIKQLNPPASNFTLLQIIKDLPDIDILITNIPGLDDLDCKVICIQDYPTSKDLAQILEAEEFVSRKYIHN